MPEITADDVAHVARLARIDLDDDERRDFARELTVIVDAVAAVREVASAEVPATMHPLPLTNVLREDTVSGVLDRQEALTGAPQTQDGCFAVPAILDEA